MTWNTDTEDFSKAVKEFEEALPGFWWSVGMCSVGAHASCGVDMNGPQGHLLNRIHKGHPYDRGFDVDTLKGSPPDALRQLLNNVLEFMALQGDQPPRRDET